MDLENPYAPPSTKSPAVRLSDRRRGGLWDGNWITFALLLPFISLLIARVPLGVSDAFLMGDRWDANYNLCMMLALLLGSLAFLVHTLALPLYKGYGWRWVAPKLIILAAWWGIFFGVLALMTAIQYFLREPR
jgi:hypothetical protein